jgi:CTD small phosphatase-like protein 2
LFILGILKKNLKQKKIGIRIRPFCIEFLEKMIKYWDIYVFTAASSSYANAIINYIDPDAKYINGILNRSNCMETKNGFFIKDMRILKDKDLKNIVMVDNLAHSFGF